MRNRSRLAKKKDSQTKKNLALTILGIILILFAIFKFGIPLLANVSLILDKTKAAQTNNDSKIYIAPPVLDPLKNATNSAQINISGKAMKDQTVKIYINNVLVDTVSASSNGNFLSEQNLSLGENIIKAKAEKNNEESDYSDPITVSFKNSNPALEVSSPSEGQSFYKDAKTVEVSGKTDSGSTVTVNGLWALLDENNNFSYELPLQNGENNIKVIATDQAGNKTEKELKVSYSP